MKTSIEFDDDVAALIKLRTRSGKTMRQVVNDLIRRAVTPLPPLRDYPTFSLEYAPGVDPNNPKAILQAMDEEESVERTRGSHKS